MLSRLVRFNEVPKDMTHMHNVLWELPLKNDMELEHYRDVTLREYLISKGVSEPYLDMACAGFANTAAGTIDNIPLGEAARQARMWEADGEFDMHLHATTYQARHAHACSIGYCVIHVGIVPADRGALVQGCRGGVELAGQASAGVGR